MTDHDQYGSFDELVSGIGAQAMDAIRLNATAYTVNTLQGALGVFDERIMILIRDVGYCEILKIIAHDPRTARLPLPPFNLTRLEDAVLFTVATHIRSIYGIVVADHCFRWAEGDFLTTMERCADAAEKIVFVRSSRHMRKGAESIRRLLDRFEYEGHIPDDFDVGSFAFRMEELFTPAINDHTMDWLSLSGAGIDRPLFRELTERTKNYHGLSKTDPARFRTMVSDEIVGRWPQKSNSAAKETSHA